MSRYVSHDDSTPRLRSGRERREDLQLFEQAKEYFDRIPDGHANAIQRPWNRSVDRVLRSMIERANNNRDCIINVGNGIYRPRPGDPVDEKELNEYLNKELHRARAIQMKLLCMKKTFDGWKDSAAYSYHSRQARESERLHNSLSLKPASRGEDESQERAESTG